MTQNPNPIFERLGADGDDIESLVAYALYKQHKRKWAQQFEKDHGTRPAPQDDVEFARVVCTEDQLNRYRQNAADLIISFANQVVEEERPEIEKEAITARIETASQSIVGAGAYGKQIIAGFVSSFITTAVLIILTIATALYGVDILDGVAKLQEKDIPQQNEVPVQTPDK